MQSLIQTNLQFLREQRRYKSVKDGNLMVARVGPSKNKSMYICNICIYFSRASFGISTKMALIVLVCLHRRAHYLLENPVQSLVGNLY